MFSRKLISIAVSWCTWSSLTSLAAAGPPALTTLSDAWVQYRVPEKAYVILKRADVEAVVVDNRGVQDEVLPGHRPQLSGIASLKHRLLSVGDACRLYSVRVTQAG